MCQPAHLCAHPDRCPGVNLGPWFLGKGGSRWSVRGPPFLRGQEGLSAPPRTTSFLPQGDPGGTALGRWTSRPQPTSSFHTSGGSHPAHSATSGTHFLLVWPGPWPAGWPGAAPSHQSAPRPLHGHHLRPGPAFSPKWPYARWGSVGLEEDTPEIKMSETEGEEARPQSRTSCPDPTPWPCRPALGPLRLCPRLGSPTSPSHRLPLALSFTALSWCPEVTSAASSHSCPWGPSPAVVGDPLPV